MGVFDAWDNDEGAREHPQGTNGHVPHFGSRKTTAYGRAAADQELARLAAATKGTRNETLNPVAFALAQLAQAGHLNWSDVEAELVATARRIGLTEREIHRTIASAVAGAASKPRSSVPDPDADPSGPTPTVLQGPPADSEFWDRRPVLAHIRDFARSRRVGPWALLGITLARTVAMVPPFVTLPPLVGGHASLNLYVGVVGRSGAGKGGAEAAAADAVASTETLETLTAGSGEAIAHAFMQRRKNQAGDPEVYQHTERVLVSVSEIDTLGALHSRTSATVLPELRKAWMGERLGFHYVDPAKRLPVPPHAYRLCMVVGIQPERAGTLLDDADGGTPQRFVWLPATDPDAPQVAPAAGQAWRWTLPRWPLASPEYAVLPVCETARRMIDEARLSRLRGQADALDGHALLARLKVAAALGLLDQRAEVAEDDWELAGTVMAVSDYIRAAVVESLAETSRKANVAKGKAEAERAVIVDEGKDAAAVNRVKRKLLKHLQAVGSESPGRLRNWLSSRDREYFEDAVGRLVEESYVDLDETLEGLRYQARR